MISKEYFDNKVMSYQGVPLYTIKTQVYKNGFKDGVSLAWSIIEELASQPAVKADAEGCTFCKGSTPEKDIRHYCSWCGRHLRTA